MYKNKGKSYIRYFFRALFEQYPGVICSIKSYWKSYGGSRGFFTSPYLHVSILLTILILKSNSSNLLFVKEWIQLILSVSPSLLGLSLAGFSVFLGIGDDVFKGIIRGPDQDGTPSPMMVFVASFTHFVLLHALVLLTAVIGKNCLINSVLYKVFSVWLFTYALVSVVATIFAIYTIAESYDAA